MRSRDQGDVATVVGAMGAGETVESVQEAFQLDREQVIALRYAAHLPSHQARIRSDQDVARCGS